MGGTEFKTVKKGSKELLAESFLTNYVDEKDLGISVSINCEKGSLRMIYIVSKNAGYISVRNNTLANDMYKYLNRLNTKKPYWQPDFLISVGDGSIYFKNEIRVTDKLAESGREIMKRLSGLIGSSLSKGISMLPKILEKMSIVS